MSGMARATALRALVPRCLPEELVRGGGLLQALHHQLGPARRHFSTDGPGSEVARQEEEAGEDNVYTGPFGTAVGKVKVTRTAERRRVWMQGTPHTCGTWWAACVRAGTDPLQPPQCHRRLPLPWPPCPCRS